MASTVSNALLKRLRESKPDPSWLEMPPEVQRELFQEPVKPHIGWIVLGFACLLGLAIAHAVGA